MLTSQSMFDLRKLLRTPAVFKFGELALIGFEKHVGYECRDRRALKRKIFFKGDSDCRTLTAFEMVMRSEVKLPRISNFEVISPRLRPSIFFSYSKLHPL